ncbi:MAG: class I SAM-dependent methyltransferase [Desulfomonile sp.]|nr:class I SAM-dependent methyltransferase [Desulfomonile sp.]
MTVPTSPVPTMDFNQFLSAVSFRFVKPYTPLPVSTRSLRKSLAHIRETGKPGWLSRLGTILEYANTVIPDDGRGTRRALMKLCGIPRMSTLAVASIINQAVARMPGDHRCVNVGVWHGFTLLAALVNNPDKTCIGVDNFATFGGPREAFLRRFNSSKSPNHYFYDMDYEEYFAHVHTGHIGFYLYDGNHDYANQLRGLEVAEPHFGAGCIIMVDDTNWSAPHRAVEDFMARRPGEYRLLLDAKTRSNCHPTLWNGLMVLKKTA